MPSATSPAGREHVRLTLNSDGKKHTLENTLTAVALVCGVIAFLSGPVVLAHAVASWAGVIGFLVGLYSQYVSATTAERAVNIVAIVMSFLGAAMGIYHGGFL
ncbi:hypothetical protein Sme01_41460 [Sphaerisporangium melleum]|uniref:Uncharacterized protein n=1 Tax=Sphaerisporangium melleum TaxID=321316 RepID=A0A917RCK0_9ACTN|nr:hypothetical protein [Sphaerisporangium melleum]GGL01259.1 hypothetical protein GCM10007964_49260 [Sphaerisporangium melleum]GII71670.1 hypothetical protein Sme01_41460 [Sphaerisporangium melleum]